MFQISPIAYTYICQYTNYTHDLRLMCYCDVIAKSGSSFSARVVNSYNNSKKEENISNTSILNKKIDYFWYMYFSNIVKESSKYHIVHLSLHI